jgi:CheY-like chemotaxis protein
MFKVLIIEDEPNNLESIRRALIDYGKFNNAEVYPSILNQKEHVATIVKYADNNLLTELKDYISNKINEFNIDVLVVDLRLQREGTDDVNESDGIQLIEALKNDQIFENMPIVIFSALGNLNEITVHEKYSHIYILGKPAMVTTNNVSNVLNGVMNRIATDCVFADN